MGSGGGSLGVGITLSWIANRGWGMGLHVRSTGLRWLVWRLVLRDLQGTQSTSQCTPAGTDRQAHGSHTMHEQFLLPTMPDNDMHRNSPLLLCESAQNPSSHYIPPPNLLCPHLLSLLLPLLHLKTLLSQAQSLPKVHHLPPLLLHCLLQLSDVVLKESNLSILVMDLKVGPAVREIQTAGC